MGSEMCIRDSYWFMHLYSTIDVKIDGNTAILSENGVEMKFEFLSSQPLTLELMEATELPSSPARDSREYANDAYRKLALHGDGLTGELNITVKMTPNIPGVPFSQIEDTPLADWKLTEGAHVESEVKPALDGLWVNGRSVGAMDPEKVSLTFCVTDIAGAMVEASCAENLTLVKARREDGNYTLTVYETGNPYNYRIYGIGFLEVPAPEGGYAPLTPVRISASAVPQSNNGPANVLDGDLSTRLSLIHI